MEHLDKLFGQFERLRRHEEFEGPSVGLGTARRMIRHRGGSI
jgi:hypothetical protein